MATTENEYYLRSILLLANGGSYISKMVLYRELSGDLDTLLKSFKSKLKHELHEKQMEKLFPGHGKTVVDTWDLQMLIIVVLRLFHTSLKVEDRMNLQAVKLLRNEVQAHSPSATLDDVQYDNIKVQLTNALTGLASSFDEDIQKECQLHINKYASGPLDVMSARECLKQLQENDAMFKQVLEKVEQSNNVLRSCINTSTTVVSQRMADLEKILLEKLERLDIGTFRKKIKVGMHVELALGAPTEEWIMLMERTLNDIFNEAYQTSEGKFENMKKRVEELLEDIKQNTTIKFKGSKTKCIILMFDCSAFAGLLDFLQYITSQKYQDRLDALTTALSADFSVDFPVTVTSKIKDECLQNAIDILDTTVEHDEIKQRVEAHQSHSSDEYKKSLRLAMECSSAKDLIYLWKMFQQGGAKQYLDRIADVLSEHSGQRITLTSSIDLEELMQAIEETVGSSVDVGTSRTTGKQTTEDPMKHIRKDVDEIYNEDSPLPLSTKLPHSGSGVVVGADYARRRRAGRSEDTDFSSHSSGGRSEDTDFSSRSSAGRSEDSAYYSHSSASKTHFVRAKSNTPRKPKTGNKRIPDDKELLSISAHIGMNWEMLGPFLGIPTPTVEQIKLDNSTTRLKIYRLLYVWRGMKGQDATVENLLTLMRMAPKAVNIAWDSVEAGRSEDTDFSSHSSGGRCEDTDFSSRSSAGRSEDSAYYSHSSGTVELPDAGEFQLHPPVFQKGISGRSEDSAYYSHSTDSVELADAVDFQLHLPFFREVISGRSEDSAFYRSSTAGRSEGSAHYSHSTVRDDSEDVKSHTQLRSDSVITSTQTKSSHVWSVESKQSYTINVEGDREDCNITGCCMLPTGEILLADRNNSTLKKLNDRYQVISVCDLPSVPWDVCYCGNNEAVLAMINSLQFVDVREGMSLTREVRTAHMCIALTCHGSQLYVVGGKSVYIYSTDGIKQRVLYTSHSDDTFFRQIAVSDDGNYIYITDFNTVLHTIDSVGNHLYTLSDAPLYGTSGVCVDGEGHVLVSMMTGNVMQLSSDGKQKLGIIVDSKDLAIRNICFNRSNSTLIVACLSNKIHVFKLK